MARLAQRVHGSRRRHGGAPHRKPRHDGARVRWRHHGCAPPLSWRHDGAWLCVGAAAALCPRGRATTAHSRVGGTTVVPYH